MTKIVKKSFNGQEMANFLKKKLENIFKEVNIGFAYLGGSWSTKSNSWWSDIDIFISVPNYFEMSAKAQLEYMMELSVKMTEVTNFEEIQISIFENLPLHVQFNAIYDGILIYERKLGLKANFIEHLLPRYYDHMIWYKQVLKRSKYISSMEKNK